MDEKFITQETLWMGFVDHNLYKSKKDLRRYPQFDPITFILGENSNYGRESLLCKTLLGVVNELLKTKTPVMFCLYTSSKLSLT